MSSNRKKTKRKTVSDFPYLLEQWHPSKNKMLDPKNVSVFSKEEVWWYLPYDDSRTGKHFEFEWTAKVEKRYYGEGCPYISGKRVWVGFNDLESNAPDLASQWHPVKNGSLLPSQVTYGSGIEAWWLYPYDDPITGKHFEFEWTAKIEKRYKRRKCPFLTGKRVWEGFNDLATTHPELAEQWHPNKNGELTPSQITAGSNKKVWWLYPYDDPVTRKHFDFEWLAEPVARVRNKGCPFLSGQRVWPGFNDLRTKNPELAKQWHPTKNRDLVPQNFMPNSKEMVMWIFPYDDPITGKHFDFEWKARITDRNYGDGCPFISSNRVWPGFNDLLTINPELAKEWHPTKNRNIRPEHVTSKSNIKVWWLCPICGRVWYASISHRANGQLCKCQN